MEVTVPGLETHSVENVAVSATVDSESIKYNASYISTMSNLRDIQNQHWIQNPTFATIIQSNVRRKRLREKRR